MDFEWDGTHTIGRVIIPPELIGYWRIGNRRYEFRANGIYYVHAQNIPYELVDLGMTLNNSGTRYNRLYGVPNDLPGVWLLEKDPTEEWNLRNDGTYSYHWVEHEYFGEYTFDRTSMSTSEMRAVLSESFGTLTFDPPYALSVSGQWSIDEQKLTITFPSGKVVYNREL